MQYLKIIDQGINAKKNQLIPVTRKPILLGRDSSCTIVYSDIYSLVSRKHAQILNSGNGSVIENLSKTNDSYVNRKPIDAKQLLFDNDLITLSPNGPSLLIVSKTSKSKKSGSSRWLILSFVFNIILGIVYLYLCHQAKSI